MSLIQKDYERLYGTNNQEDLQSQFEGYIYGSHRGWDAHEDKVYDENLMRIPHLDIELLDLNEAELDAIDRELVEYYEDGNQIDFIDWIRKEKCEEFEI